MIQTEYKNTNNTNTNDNVNDTVNDKWVRFVRPLRGHTNTHCGSADEEIGGEGIQNCHLIFLLFFDIIIVGKNEMKN